MNRKQCFRPVVDSGTRLLVLGSLPGEKSLAQGQYYANKQNQFWLLMSEVIGINLAVLPYSLRLQALLDHRVGLWDVVAEARRSGSLDANIRDRNDNDLLGLLTEFPNIGALAFNGRTAAKIGLEALGERASGYQIVQLPSSSPAYTMAYSGKLEDWKKLVACLPLKDG